MPPWLLTIQPLNGNKAFGWVGNKHILSWLTTFKASYDGTYTDRATFKAS